MSLPVFTWNDCNICVCILWIGLVLVTSVPTIANVDVGKKSVYLVSCYLFACFAYTLIWSLFVSWPSRMLPSGL